MYIDVIRGILVNKTYIALNSLFRQLDDTLIIRHIFFLSSIGIDLFPASST